MAMSLLFAGYFAVLGAIFGVIYTPFSFYSAVAKIDILWSKMSDFMSILGDHLGGQFVAIFGQNAHFFAEIFLSFAKKWPKSGQKLHLAWSVATFFEKVGRPQTRMVKPFVRVRGQVTTFFIKLLKKMHFFYKRI